jgi:casein kinase 1
VDLVSATLTQICSLRVIDTSLGSVYLGKDIRTGAEVALKIGGTGQSPLRLKHEYTVYTSIAGSTGISPVLWYGKEGPYEVIVLNNLGKSLGDLVGEDQFDCGKVFLYASQMVTYTCDLYTNGLANTLSCTALSNCIAT